MARFNTTWGFGVTFRALPDGFELDDDPDRIDVDAVHAFIATQSYWGRGRPLELVERAIRGSARVVGLYHDGQQVGFARAITDGAILAYLSDVYVLAAHRGRGLGLELVREMIDNGPYRKLTWLLHSADAQGVYEKLGFTSPSIYPLMERAREKVPGEAPYEPAPAAEMHRPSTPATGYPAAS